MLPRQHDLLNEIILRYTETAQPVSSLQIAESGRFEVSPATIRNDMATLEQDGYIAQPHTSSGRTPTEKGYRYFIQNTFKERELAGRQRQALDEVMRVQQEYRNALRELAKAMAAMSSTASFVAAEPNDPYLTGLGNLLAQPEFSRQDQARELAVTVDRFDELLDELFKGRAEHMAILIGQENPFSANCSTIVVRYQTRHGQGVVGLLGPVRMNYEQNAAILRHAQQLIHELMD